MTTFHRQLNIYGFKKLAGTRHTARFVHSSFVRGRPDLLSHVTRKVPPRNKQKRPKRKRSTLSLVAEAEAVLQVTPKPPCGELGRSATAGAAPSPIVVGGESVALAAVSRLGGPSTAAGVAAPSGLGLLGYILGPRGHLQNTTHRDLAESAAADAAPKAVLQSWSRELSLDCEMRKQRTPVTTSESTGTDLTVDDLLLDDEEVNDTPCTTSESSGDDWTVDDLLLDDNTALAETAWDIKPPLRLPRMDIDFFPCEYETEGALELAA